MKNLGLGAVIVDKLCRTITLSWVLYTDRFFTSLKLAGRTFAGKKCDKFLTGTVMPNRIGPDAKKLKNDKTLKIGQWDEKVRDDKKL